MKTLILSALIVIGAFAAGYANAQLEVIDMGGPFFMLYENGETHQVLCTIVKMKEA